MQKLKAWLKYHMQFLFLLYVLLAIFASAQALLLKSKYYPEADRNYTTYNNYIIFKQSHHHLLQQKDLYQVFEEEHWDLYKYSPSFALLFGAIAYLPDTLGLSLWNLLNALLLFFAIRYLPQLSSSKKAFILLFIVLELLTAIQNAQSNALIAGLVILSFGLLERQKWAWASLCIVSSVFIKLFGLVAFALFLFYPQKWKLALYTLGWSILLFLLPLPFIGFDQLSFLYQSWLNLLSEDHSTSYGLSVMGWLSSWFGLDISKNIIVLVGVILFCVPLLHFKAYGHISFRMGMLASVLLWVVIFNHKAESPTFIIAMCGIAIWYFSKELGRWDIAILIGAFIFTSLSPSDLFPKFVRVDIFQPYVIKAIPSILIWILLIISLIQNPFPKEIQSE